MDALDEVHPADSMGDETLPPGWTGPLTRANGEVFWYNCHTGESRVSSPMDSVRLVCDVAGGSSITVRRRRGEDSVTISLITDGDRRTIQGRFRQDECRAVMDPHAIAAIDGIATTDASAARALFMEMLALHVDIASVGTTGPGEKINWCSYHGRKSECSREN